MVKKIALSLLSIALAGAQIPLLAATCPKIEAKRELIALGNEARIRIAVRQNPDADPSEGGLAELVRDRMPYIHSCLGERDVYNLHAAAAHLDTALSQPHSHEEVREKTVFHLNRMLAEQIHAACDELSGIQRIRGRIVPKILSKQEKKEQEKKEQEKTEQAAHVRAKVPEKNTVPVENHEQVEEQPEELEENSDIVQWLMDNPRTVAVGALTIYGLLAKYFGWVPFNEKPDAAAQSAPQAEPSVSGASLSMQQEAAPSAGNSHNTEQQGPGVFERWGTWFSSWFNRSAQSPSEATGLSANSQESASSQGPEQSTAAGKAPHANQQEELTISGASASLRQSEPSEQAHSAQAQPEAARASSQGSEQSTAAGKAPHPNQQEEPAVSGLSASSRSSEPSEQHSPSGEAKKDHVGIDISEDKGPQPAASSDNQSYWNPFAWFTGGGRQNDWMNQV